MNLHFSAEDIAFRAEARDWLHEHVPRERRPHAGPAARAFDLAWQALRPGGRSAFALRELPPDSDRRLFTLGLLTNLLNPKAAMLYL